MVRAIQKHVGDHAIESKLSRLLDRRSNGDNSVGVKPTFQ